MVRDAAPTCGGFPHSRFASRTDVTDGSLGKMAKVSEVWEIGSVGRWGGVGRWGDGDNCQGLV
ncbi:hypothetical protein [Moorena sp. SIO4G3]|uniref:hypothetical protein n=1 Tax=Moorena sp. SIO4G3 TaxID=2607821 RepID=UPI00142BE8EC|nr:hypothetical protein [Moorena sp. SIO4G3]NEO79255.1 hypothetical protein [Moorena sp. SIO4G3]